MGVKAAAVRVNWATTVFAADVRIKLISGVDVGVIVGRGVRVGKGVQVGTGVRVGVKVNVNVDVGVFVGVLEGAKVKVGI